MLDPRVKRMVMPLKQFNLFNPEKPFILTSYNRFGKPLNEAGSGQSNPKESLFELLRHS